MSMNEPMALINEIQQIIVEEDGREVSLLLEDIHFCLLHAEMEQIDLQNSAIWRYLLNALDALEDGSIELDELKEKLNAVRTPVARGGASPSSDVPSHSSDVP